MSRKTATGCAAALGLFTILGACLAVVVLLFARPSLGSLRTRCSVGVVGTGASVTVQGMLAGRACREFLRNQPDSFYELTQAATQPVVCEYQRGRQRFIVRDEGALKLVGNVLCQGLRTDASGTVGRLATAVAPAAPTQVRPVETATIADVVVTTGVDADGRPLVAVSEVPLGREVFITYTARRFNKGDGIVLRLTRNGQPVQLPGGDPTYRFEQAGTCTCRFRLQLAQPGDYRGEIFVEGETTPRATAMFTIR